jgi:acetate kinase
MPPEAFLYALPYELYELHGLRRFGFHGLSHRHAITEAAEALGAYPESIKVLSVHLDAETSVAAFANGRCVDTSSGLAVHSGLMGARSSGTVDPAVVSFLERNEKLSVDDVEKLLTEKAGIFGLSGLSAELTDVIAEAEKGDERCKRTIDVVVFGLTKAIGGLAASMGGVEVLIFTGSVGVKTPLIRRLVCEKLSFLGIDINVHKNEAPLRSKPKKISTAESSAEVFIVPSNVARTIAEDCVELVLDGVPK